MAPSRKKTAILLMAHGAADSVKDLSAYLKSVLNGRPVPPMLVREIVVRRGMIGGRSPLNGITRAQARALKSLLVRRGRPARVELGMLHIEPGIKAALGKLSRRDPGRVLALPLTPYAATARPYWRALDSARGKRRSSLRLVRAAPWHAHPLLIRAFASKIRRALARDPKRLRSTGLLFAAHSLPKARLPKGDTYVRDLSALSRAVASAVGTRRWSLAFHGANDRRLGPWLGPNVERALTALARKGARRVVAAPIGHVSDSAETLYDLGVACRRAARNLGLRFARAEAPNASPALIGALADIVESSEARS